MHIIKFSGVWRDGSTYKIRQEKNKRLYNLKLESKVDESEAVLGIYEMP